MHQKIILLSSEIKLMLAVKEERESLMSSVHQGKTMINCRLSHLFDFIIAFPVCIETGPYAMGDSSNTGVSIQIKLAILPASDFSRR